MGSESQETVVARLDERVKGHDQFIEQIADDIKRMAVSYEKLVESNHRVALIEQDLVTAKISLTKLWEKSDANEIARAARDQRQAEEALAAQIQSIADEHKERNRWKREILIACVPAVAALAAYHFLGVRIS